METHTIQLVGDIDNHHYFKKIKVPKGVKTLFLDLSGVESINSIGISKWMDWITPLGDQCRIVLENVPSCIIMQVNMLEDFIPAGTTIKSFYVPFYCDFCEHEVKKLARTGIDVYYEDGVFVDNFNVSTDCTGELEICDLEMDVNRQNYYRFLRGK